MGDEKERFRVRGCEDGSGYRITINVAKDFGGSDVGIYNWGISGHCLVGGQEEEIWSNTPFWAFFGIGNSDSFVMGTENLEYVHRLLMICWMYEEWAGFHDD